MTDDVWCGIQGTRAQRERRLRQQWPPTRRKLDQGLQVLAQRMAFPSHMPVGKKMDLVFFPKFNPLNLDSARPRRSGWDEGLSERGSCG